MKEQLVSDLRTSKEIEEDVNLQFIVLLNLIIEKIEYLEDKKYVFGSIKMFLKNSKTKYEKFMSTIFAQHEKHVAQESTKATLIIQERVERALINEYIISVDQRKQRTNDILLKYIKNKKHLPNIIKEMEDKNLFNF